MGGKVSLEDGEVVIFSIWLNYFAPMYKFTKFASKADLNGVMAWQMQVFYFSWTDGMNKYLVADIHF